MKNNLIGMSFAGLVIFLMVGASVFFSEKEIIFPEIAALTVGTFLTPKILWKDTGKFKFVFLMTLSSVFGLCLTSIVPIPVFLRVIMGCIFTLICVSSFKSGLLPMLSACILPALLNITSIIYPISVFCCSLAIVLLRELMGKIAGDNGFEERKTDTIYFSKKELTPKLIAFGIIILYSVYPSFSGELLLIAPPLMVLFMEVFTDNEKLKGREWYILITGILCCTFGAVFAYFFNDMILLAGILDILTFLILMSVFKVYMPPIAALCFLPLILPKEKLLMYPLLTGITILLIVIGILIKRHRKTTGE